MNDLLIVKNILHEGPGLLESILQEASITSTIVDLERGQPCPSPLGYKALIVLGGPDSANDTSPKMLDELKLVKIALDNNLPFLGICLGMQVAVKAAGGSVMKAPQKEIGFIDPVGSPNTVELTDTGKTDPLLNGLISPLAVFHLHGETVKLTDTMQLLGTGKYCTNQIIKVAEKAYGIQSHFELTAVMLKSWAAEDPDLQSIGEKSLLSSFKKIEATYTTIGQTYLTNFLRIAGLMS